MTRPPRFHLAFPVTDLGEARRFYGDFLGCAEGRSSGDWVDFDPVRPPRNVVTRDANPNYPT